MKPGISILNAFWITVFPLSVMFLYFVSARKSGSFWMTGPTVSKLRQSDFDHLAVIFQSVGLTNDEHLPGSLGPQGPS